MKTWPAILLIATVHAADAGVPSLEQVFSWEEANTRMATARTEADFLLAARIYLRLVHAGVRNGSLFYNLGTALLKARRYEEAVSAFRRAERFMGSSPEIRRNLLLALAHEDKNAAEGLGWTRWVLFWHYGLGLRTRATVAAWAFCAFWVVLALRVVGVRRLTGTLLAVAAGLVVLFGSSAVGSWQQEMAECPILVGGEPAVPAVSEALPATNAPTGVEKRP